MPSETQQTSTRTSNKRILIAVDDSDASMRAVQYVADTIGGQDGLQVRLFHVLPPIPPEQLEFIGSSDPKEEEAMQAKQKDQQAEWIKQAKKTEQPVFKKARAILLEAGVPAQKVKGEYCSSVHQREIPSDILETAQADHCQTIVVGRESFLGVKGFFQHHIGDELIRKGQGFTIWVVE